MDTGPSQQNSGRLAIIAGQGSLPAHLAQAARAAGDNPLIIGLRAEYDQRFDGFDHVEASIADIASISRLFRRYQIDRVVLSGAVSRRPDWRELRPTFKTFRKIPEVVKALVAGGDDAILRVAISVIEAEGARVIGAHDIAPSLLASVGPLGRISANRDDLRDIDMAACAARCLGDLDVGQGSVSVGGRVVALEGVEGTDQMLGRVAQLRADGRISRRCKGVLVKLCKPNQDIRADLPTIGPSTVENAVKAGLSGIAVEAGRALVLERDRMIGLADEAGIFICGIDLELERGGLS